MVIRKLLFCILLPFSILYGLIGFIRNFFFSTAILPEYASGKIVTISVGNLSVGGTGKTPHVEYLVRLLKDRYKIATLSRGYGRKTKGYILADKKATSEVIGDESLQYLRKFDNINVAVSEKRKIGIVELEKLQNSPQIVVLDDAFQHRYVKPSLSILLTDYSKPFYSDFVLPSGRLREFAFGYKRADIIIVTKCPEKFDRESILAKIKPQKHQHVFFSYLEYGLPEPLTNIAKQHSLENAKKVVLFTAIANAKPLYNYLAKEKEVVSLEFPDHHNFTNSDLNKVTDTYNSLEMDAKVLVTTEKDSMRLDLENTVLKNIPVYYIPIEVKFIGDSPKFDTEILNFVAKNVV